jgi:hypothetical protein
VSIPAESSGRRRPLHTVASALSLHPLSSAFPAQLVDFLIVLIVEFINSVKFNVEKKLSPLRVLNF